MMPQNQPLNPQQVGQILINLKKQLSQVEGEISTMRGDAQSAVFNNVGQILNQIYQEMDQLKEGRLRAEKALEDIYHGWPDVKIAMEKKIAEGKKDAPKAHIVKGNTKSK